MSERARLRQAGRMAVAALLVSFASPALAQRSYQELTYPPLRDIAVPDVARTELSNGLVLYLLEDHTLPKVQGFAFIRTGERYDPPERLGPARISEHTMSTGGATTPRA